jgi:thiamine biosynthesis protein ThiS
MTIQLNGTATETSATSVQDLLSELGLAEKPVVVEYNEHALLKGEHAETTLQENDRLEVITLAAGG